MRTGLTFDEYVELRLTPPAGADRVFHKAAKTGREQMFPMKTTVASHHLRARGYDCKPAMLELLVKNGVVKLAEPDTWTQADVDTAAEHFRRMRDLRAVRGAVPSARLRLRGFPAAAA